MKKNIFAKSETEYPYSIVLQPICKISDTKNPKTCPLLPLKLPVHTTEIFCLFTFASSLWDISYMPPIKSVLGLFVKC